MAILITDKSRVIVQGFTGKIATFHAEDMIKYGTNIVGGTTPGRGGESHLNKPVFNTVQDAVEQEGADTSIIFVPGPFAADAIMEAAEAGIKFCVCITDGIPTLDMIRVKRYMRAFAKESKMVLTGPNCAGSISPGKAMLGIMPGHIYKEGRVGVIGRSGTLGYEAAVQMADHGIGISSSIGIGGDPINGSGFKDHLQLFNDDPETDAIVMIGEIGGSQEAQAAEWARDNCDKPVISYIAGLTAPKGRTMGHAGAIVSSSGESAAEKVEILRACGVHVAVRPSDIGTTVAAALKGA